MRSESPTTESTIDPAGDNAVVGTAGHPPVVPRRRVLKVIGVGGTALLVAGTGVLGYRAIETDALHHSQGPAYDPWVSWRTEPGPVGAVAAAVLAANPHNTQPWTFAVTDSSIDVYLDTARTLGTLDPTRREQHVGLGCALENLVVACRARGLEPSVQLMPTEAEPGHVARVTLASAAPVSSSLYDAIGDRHTNRGPYDGREVTAAARDDLVDTAGLAGVSVQWITEPAQKAVLGQLMVDAALAITQDEQQSLDSFAWFRADGTAIEEHRDGLTLDAQGMSPLTLGIAKMLPPSSRNAGDSFWVDQTRTVHTKTAAAYGIITVADSEDRTSQLTAGRLLQRLHLTATTRGIALQHMNQVTERIERESLTGSAATFGPRLADLLPALQRPLATFRIGYATREALPSPRRDLAAVTR